MTVRLPVVGGVESGDGERQRARCNEREPIFGTITSFFSHGLSVSPKFSLLHVLERTTNLCHEREVRPLDRRRVGVKGDSDPSALLPLVLRRVDGGWEGD